MAKTGGDPTANKLICACGGDIKVFATGERGRLRMVAECQSCKKRARKPKELFDKSTKILKDN